MNANWLRVAAKNEWLPKGGIQDGVFAPEWYPTMDCPAALTTLVWINRSAGIVGCPPNATMFTFYETSKSPTISRTGSKQVTCNATGQYSLPPGWGLLCGNSVRLRPQRNEKAIERAKGLMKKRDEAQVESSERDRSRHDPPHVLLYMMDAVSRPSLFRSLKSTRRSIEAVANRSKELGTNVFEFGRHHSVGGSSIRNLTPMLTGLLLSQLEAKQKKYQAWAFEEFKRSGYIAINTHNHCWRFDETFGARFDRHTPEHYFPFEMEDIKWFGPFFCQPRKGEFTIPVDRACAKTPDATQCFPSPENNMDRISCLGGRSRSSLLVEHYLHARANHAEVPTFGHIHDYDLHIQNLVALHMYDDDKARILPMLEEANIFNDTVVILLSDHGSQHTITATTQGALEYKMPFLYMFVPDVVLNQHPGWREALEWNQQVLTAPQDIHETMIALAGGRGVGDADWWKTHGHDSNVRGSSLLEKLPYDRSCVDAGIPETECTCGGGVLNEIEKGSAKWNFIVSQYAPKLMSHINGHLLQKELTPKVCRTLQLDSLLYAASHQASDNYVGYQVRFSVVSPRTQPMEMYAVFGVSVHTKALIVDTIIQTSRFAHWVDHCKDDVTAVGGNHHYCDCSQAPDGGWKSITKPK